jgi:hypothetical protein
VSRVTLLDNGIDPISLSADGPFRFPRPVASGAMYAVTVGTQPATQRCGVTRGVGTVDAIDVTTVQVTCADTYLIGGTLIGATTAITLTNNAEDLVVASNGSFAFAQRLLPGELYAISVKVQPSDGKTLCTVDVPTGTVGIKDVSTFVHCTKIGTSCADILATNPGATDGKYYLDPDGAGPVAPFIAVCDMTLDNGGWMLVQPGFVSSTGGSHVAETRGTDSQGGALLGATAIPPVNGSWAVGYNCGIVSSHELFFKDLVPWTQIRSDWAFTGNGYCFSIFGNTSNMPGATPLGVTPFQLGVDVIRKQKNMGGLLSDTFDGVDGRCDNVASNFWASANDFGSRSAEVILRRTSSTVAGGIGLGVSCVNYNNAPISIPTWQFSNMWLR